MERVSDYVKKPEAVKMYLYHITIMCNHDEEMTSWFTRWHAQLIQFPAVKSRSPAFTSRQGAGKGEIILALQAMLGRLKVMETPNPAEDAFGKFNTLMVEALVVCFDELNAAALRLFLDRLKNAQTSGVINIEFKGQNKFMMNSIHRFMSAWNEGDPIPTGEDDRRNVIIRSSDELIGNTEYHVKFHAMLKDTNSVKSIYEYFKSTENFPDMALFHTVKPPVSDHHKDSKALNRSAPDIWLESFTQAKLDAFAAAGAAPCIDRSDTPGCLPAVHQVVWRIRIQIRNQLTEARNCSEAPSHGRRRREGRSRQRRGHEEVRHRRTGPTLWTERTAPGGSLGDI